MMQDVLVTGCNRNKTVERHLTLIHKFLMCFWLMMCSPACLPQTSDLPNYWRDGIQIFSGLWAAHFEVCYMPPAELVTINI